MLETLATQYASLCLDYIKGNTKESIRNQLDVMSCEVYRDLSSDIVVKIHLDSLIRALGPDPIEMKCFERYYELVKAACRYHNNELVKQIERFSGTKMTLPDFVKYMEETGFMLSKLAEMTEYLDYKIAQMSPFEMQLRKLEQISHTIVQNANFGVLVVDSSFSITMINKAAAEILAIPENSIGCTLEEVFAGHAKEITAVMLNALSGDRHQLVEVDIKGKTKILDIVSDRLLDKTGTREGGVALINDVSAVETEKKVMEENIKLATVGKLAAGVAHEIKNPLTVIKGFSQLLLSKKLDPDITNYLQIICEEAERANAFIQDFLKLGKPKEPRKRVIDAREIVLETIALLESQCFLHGIEIVPKLDISGEIFADPDQIKQVLLNLAKNSVEAMETNLRPRKLTFEIWRDDIERTLNISVRDTGVGISEEILEKITTPFFTTKKFGTGLGLNISQNIIERHGGSLTVTSNEEETTATIMLPLK